MTRRLFAHEVIQTGLELLDDEKLDREWIVRNVLGGMAAGFGLRGTKVTSSKYGCAGLTIVSGRQSC